MYRTYGTAGGDGRRNIEKRKKKSVRRCSRADVRGAGLVQTASAYFKQDGRRERTDRAARLLCAGRMERPEETGAGTLTDEKRVQNGVLDRMCGKMMCEIG